MESHTLEMDEWSASVVPQVFTIISSKVSQKDVCILASVNTFARRFLLSHHPLWKVLDLHGATRAGERLAAATLLPQFTHVEDINLEFAQGLEDHDLQCLEGKKDIRKLNLNACQSITDIGLEIVAKFCPKLGSFSIYWNLRVTDNGVEALAKNCKEITRLNLSGCKGITDKTLETISIHCSNMESLNLTRCVRLTDNGMTKILESCKNIRELYLYAVSTLTDNSYIKLENLEELRILDLCGAQHLTDDGISQGLSKCKNLQSLNLTWCVNVTDRGIKLISSSCSKLQLLRFKKVNVKLICFVYTALMCSVANSLHGLLGVTDDGLQSLSRACYATLTTIDVNGCINIKKRSETDLHKLFPHIKHFRVHS